MVEWWSEFRLVEGCPGDILRVAAEMIDEGVPFWNDQDVIAAALEEARKPRWADRTAIVLPGFDEVITIPISDLVAKVSAAMPLRTRLRPENEAERLHRRAHEKAAWAAAAAKKSEGGGGGGGGGGAAAAAEEQDEFEFDDAAAPVAANAAPVAAAAAPMSVPEVAPAPAAAKVEVEVVDTLIPYTHKMGTFLRYGHLDEDGDEVWDEGNDLWLQAAEGGKGAYVGILKANGVIDSSAEVIENEPEIV